MDDDFIKVVGAIIAAGTNAVGPVKALATGAQFIEKISDFRAKRFRARIERLFLLVSEGVATDAERRRLANFFQQPSEERDTACAIVFSCLERTEEENKTEIYAHLLLNLVAGRIKFSQFKDAALCLDKAYFESLLYLADLAERGYEYRSQTSVDMASEAQLYAAGIGYREGDRFTITQIGRDLYEFGMEKAA